MYAPEKRVPNIRYLMCLMSSQLGNLDKCSSAFPKLYAVSYTYIAIHHTPYNWYRKQETGNKTKQKEAHDHLGKINVCSKKKKKTEDKTSRAQIKNPSGNVPSAYTK